MHSWHVSSWIIPRVTNSVYYQRFIPPPFRFSFLSHITWVSKAYHCLSKFTHNTKTIKYFRRGSYQIPSYLVPHRHKYLYTGSWMLTLSFWSLPHQQCFSGIFTVLSTIFRPQPSYGHPLLEVVHYWKLSFSTVPILFLSTHDIHHRHISRHVN